MKKKLFIFLILPLLLMQSLFGLFVWTSFQVNRDLIAKTQCENRFNAMASKCHGQCVLMKKMKKIRDAESKKSDLKLENYASVYCFQEIIGTDFELSILDIHINKFEEYQNSYHYDYSYYLIKPPLV